MQDLVEDRILRRELGRQRYDDFHYSSIQGLYGSRSQVENLDIVNELGGHSGCVNALSWSRSGRLLASGSDDTNVNIHTYLSESSNAPFTLATTITTGHVQNIFSVKFMPHSNDQTIISCAGDHEVRVFDIEYTNRSSRASGNSRTSTVLDARTGVQHLSPGDCNGRVYRCHSSRVKRIVTESSPHLFLTCAEDGEVRQWDLRLPSAAYPARESRSSLSLRSEIPTPLISYKNYNLDLNTISCSASQPHYIALGGNHLHCFLHDRRMSGRDLLSEQGKAGPSHQAQNNSDQEDEMMAQATRCVRKFAPNGVQAMKRSESGHITACKISDKFPNEMIASWSGDWVYSFDLLNSPDARELRASQAYGKSSVESPSKRKCRHSKDRKSKRSKSSPKGSLNSDLSDRDSGPMDSLMTDQSSVQNAQDKSHQVAKDIVEIRDEIIGLKSSKSIPKNSESPEQREESISYSAAVAVASRILPQIDEIITQWRYPLDPDDEEVRTQNRLREARELSRRFVQAAGTIAKMLSSSSSSPNEGENEAANQFKSIYIPHSTRLTSQSLRFSFDFLKAIHSWIGGGLEELQRSFTSPTSARNVTERHPIPDGAGVESIQEILIPYLLDRANSKGIIDVDASKFEKKATRIIFQTEKQAVEAFGRAIETQSNTSEGLLNVTNSSNDSLAAAHRFWGTKVARGVLQNVGKWLNFDRINGAFDSLGLTFGEDESAQDDVGGADRSISENDEDSEISDDEMKDDSDDINEASDSDSYNDEQSHDTSEEYVSSRLPQRMYRFKAESHILCSPHTRTYRGHCNVKTVKDVNFYGQDDEYVVSGSDDGNFFIWDKRTSELVNILSGDDQVVNVIQGHPIEPMLAVSGIDDTIKIFSPDSRAQEDARQGINVTRSLSTGFSSLDWRPRIRRQAPRPTQPSSTVTGKAEPENKLESRKRMAKAYEIMAENDKERQEHSSSTHITGSMLARIAAHISQSDSNMELEGGVILDENCSVSAQDGILWELI